jgi:hypothetical protein
MNSVKELTEKLKKLNTECFVVRCYYELFDDGTELFTIDIRNYDKIDLKVLIYIYKEHIVLEFKEYNTLYHHYTKEFKKETYTNAEKVELLSVLSQLNEYSDTEILNKFNSFLHE